MERKRLSLPLETSRLILRTPDPADARLVQDAIEESFEVLHPWMPWAVELQSFEETRAFLERAQANCAAGEDYGLSAFLRASGQFALGAGIHPRSWQVPKFEIGYWCRKSLQHRGLATEVVKALASAAFNQLGAQRVEIRCDSRNEASSRVAERAGFSLEANLKNDDRANDGTLRDTLVYSLLPEDLWRLSSPAA
jgi:RimJ/RimL family protein N-acetyltransferase